ncbi:MAG: acyl-CoA dehydrogenase family protein [Chloroflexi bacterium]|nr:acyl-CoA dehydrogenase family protein [Chloroflexota bacterium]
MDFDLTQQQEMLRDYVREFVARFCPREKVREWDEAGKPPSELFERMAENGFLGIAVDPEYGGTGGDIISQSIILQELEAQPKSPF